MKAIGKAPAVFLEGVYLAGAPQERVTGPLKVAFYAGDQSSALCTHDEVGYRKAFASVAASFFTSFKRRGASESKPKWLEVSKIVSDTTDVAFMRTRVLPGAGKGELSYEQRGTILIPASAKDLVIGDSLVYVELDARGKLKKGTWVTTRSGELKLRMILTAEKNEVHYEGTLGGKPVKGELSLADGFASPLDPAMMLKKQFTSGKPFKQVLYEYHPSVNPLALMPVTYTHEEAHEPRQVEIAMGKTKIDAKMDASGMPESVIMSAGSKSMRISREFVEGSL